MLTTFPKQLRNDDSPQDSPYINKQGIVRNFKSTGTYGVLLLVNARIPFVIGDICAFKLHHNTVQYNFKPV